MTRTIELPKLSSLYGRAAADAVRSKVTSGGGLRGLSVEPVVAQHPGISQTQAEQYRQLVAGEAFDGTHRTSLPSVLVHIAAFPVQMGLMSGKDFPLPLMGMVHLANEVEHHKPISPETPLQIRAAAENFRPHRKGTQVDISVEIYPQDVDVDSADEATLLWSGVSTYLGIGAYVAGKPEGEQTRRGQGDFTPPRKTGQWSLGAGAGREYAAVSGDYNPIHVSGIAAKALGQRGLSSTGCTRPDACLKAANLRARGTGGASISKLRSLCRARSPSRSSRSQRVLNASPAGTRERTDDTSLGNSPFPERTAPARPATSAGRAEIHHLWWT